MLARKPLPSRSFKISWITVCVCPVCYRVHVQKRDNSGIEEIVLCSRAAREFCNVKLDSLKEIKAAAIENRPLSIVRKGPRDISIPFTAVQVAFKDVIDGKEDRCMVPFQYFMWTLISFSEPIIFHIRRAC